MNKKELKELLVQLNVNPGFYSLNGDILPDRMVIYQNYDKWEVFYFDEKGIRRKEHIFSSENDACKYLYEHFKTQKEIGKKYNIKQNP